MGISDPWLAVIGCLSLMLMGKPKSSPYVSAVLPETVRVAAYILCLRADQKAVFDWHRRVFSSLLT